MAEAIPAGPGADTEVLVRRGEVLQLEVRGDVLDSVLIERLDRVEAIEPTTPARFEFLADAAAGVYPIRLVEADRRIGSIEDQRLARAAWASCSGMKRPVPSHHGQVTSCGLPPRFEITWPVPRQAWQRPGSSAGAAPGGHGRPP